MSNSLIVGYTKQDESRGASATLFPFVDILDGAGTAYTSFGSEPFTPNNELRYNTFQLQDSFTKFGKKHTLTFGGAVEKYHSENVFFPGKQSAYVYNSLADFQTDATDFLANPNRTTSPITLRRFQVRYMNIPDLEKPIQPLDVWYTSGYVQDEFRPLANLTLTAGVRVDIAAWGDTAYANADVDALTFRDPSRSPVQFSTGKLPDASPLWSPRIGFNWDVSGKRNTQVRGGTGVFTGKPAYVWISNQIGNTGVLTGFVQADNTRAFPFTTDTGQLQADQRHRRAGGERRPGRHRHRLQVPADLAHQHRRRPAAAVGPRRHRRADLQQGRQRAVVLQRQPAGGADDVQRARSAGALGRHVLHGADGHAVRHAHQQRDRQPDHERHRADQLERGPGLELRRQRQEEPAGRPQRAGRLQLRRVEDADRSRLHRRRLVHRQRHLQRPEQPGAGLLGELAGASHVHQRHLHEEFLRLGRDERLGVLDRVHQRQHQLRVLRRHERRHRVRQRPDLHPA